MYIINKVIDVGVCLKGLESKNKGALTIIYKFYSYLHKTLILCNVIYNKIWHLILLFLLKFLKIFITTTSFILLIICIYN